MTSLKLIYSFIIYSYYSFQCNNDRWISGGVKWLNTIKYIHTFTSSTLPNPPMPRVATTWNDDDADDEDDEDDDNHDDDDHDDDLQIV